MSEVGSTNEAPAASLFGFRGRIGPARYWAHVAGTLAVLVASFIFAAMASDPRGGDGSLLLAFPLFGIFIWLLATAMTQRLRNAGKPPVLVLAFIIAQLGVLFLAIALIELAPFAGLIGFFGVLALVGHI